MSSTFIGVFITSMFIVASCSSGGSNASSVSSVITSPQPTETTDVVQPEPRGPELISHTGQNSNVRILLPERYEVVSSEPDLESLISDRMTPQQQQQIRSGIAAGGIQFSMMAVDGSQPSGEYVPNVLVLYGPDMGGPLDTEFVATEYRSRQTAIDLIHVEATEISGNPAVVIRGVDSQTIPGVDIYISSAVLGQGNQAVTVSFYQAGEPTEEELQESLDSFETVEFLR